VNADEIARGLSPFRPEKSAVEAGRIMLRRMDELLNRGENFAFETTLAAKIYRNKILNAKAKGYAVTLLFFWLQTIEMAKERVMTRVSEGGHGIESEVIERRYLCGIKNLFDIYIPISDDVLIFDNSGISHELIARKTNGYAMIATNESKFNKLKEYYDNKG
jgi:predicted ABC-type ATPase